MRAVLLSAGLIIVLAGCKDAMTSKHRIHFDGSTGPDFHVECLDGVEYWHRIEGGGHRGYLTAKIDPKTLQPSTCPPKAYGEGCTKTGNVLTCPLPE